MIHPRFADNTSSYDFIDRLPVDESLRKSLFFDQSIGFLATHSDDRLRLVGFRVQNVYPEIGTIVGIEKMVNRPLASANATNSVSGSGVYFGNTPESVALMSFGKGRKEIGVFLSEPFAIEEIVDESTKESQARLLIKKLWHMTKSNSRMNSRHIAETEFRHGDTKVIVVDAGPDVTALQNVLAGNVEHVLPPLWAVVRGSDRTFTRIGSVQPFIPRPLVARSIASYRKVAK